MRRGHQWTRSGRLRPETPAGYRPHGPIHAADGWRRSNPHHSTGRPRSQGNRRQPNDPAVFRHLAAQVGARAYVSKATLARDLLPTIAEVVDGQNGHTAAPVVAPVNSTVSSSASSTGSSQPSPAASSPATPGADLDFLAGGGEMGAVMRATDWSKTPLGAADKWPPALRMMVKFLLANRFPQLLWWGPQFCSLYNDAYVPILGPNIPGRSASP